MSTTFEVYPATSYVPTLVNVLKVANRKLQHFLSPFALKEMPVIYARIGEEILSQNDKNDKDMAWGEGDAWFYVEPGSGGGTDAYYEIVDAITIEIREEYGEDGEDYLEVKRSLSVGHYWIFRRSAGQPAIINLVYGILASALAELTEGYIHSDDGAWNGKPVRSDEFDKHYFVSGAASTCSDAVWYEQCLQGISSQYGGIPYELEYQALYRNDLSCEQRLLYYPSLRTFREGAAVDDRLFLLLSQFANIPYVVVDRLKIIASEHYENNRED
ncbi:hypothetical protein M6D81_15860 [Paenibacillus sp. J5C_2022]|uniref:hypothetical protein n=1 Tax=Paenibacillus sp. J5C2022 TaxID=2977129 RepID=UPI0021CF2F9D|nr:hypothetical protein [Paenibacillus sp. J5C2022]MCU6710174.1 hypothetical protein [Paenibacillus sp. J5C2022]